MKKSDYHKRQNRLFYPNYPRIITPNRKKFCGLLIAGFSDFFNVKKINLGNDKPFHGFIFTLIMAFCLIFCFPGQNLIAIESEGSEGITDVSASGSMVGLDGKFNYSYPIQVAPGTSGVQPGLSLSYTSSGGSGMMGAGWNISGLGAVTRRGKWGGVPQYDSTDVFYWNGQKLIKESSGWIYHTARESYNRIEASGDPGAGTSTYWTVKTKDETTSYYGYDDTNCKSRINTVGLSTNHTHTWALDRVVDVSGNTLKVYYSGDGVNINKDTVLFFTLSNSGNPHFLMQSI